MTPAIISMILIIKSQFLVLVNEPQLLMLEGRSRQTYPMNGGLAAQATTLQTIVFLFEMNQSAHLLRVHTY